MAKGKIDLTFGAFARPLSEQLDVAPTQVSAHQRRSDAITLLIVGGILSEAEARRCRLRVVKQITEVMARLDRVSGGKP